MRGYFCSGGGDFWIIPFSKSKYPQSIQPVRLCTRATHLLFVTSRFVGAGGQIEARYTWDGLHLNAAGYRLWVSIIND